MVKQTLLTGTIIVSLLAPATALAEENRSTNTTNRFENRETKVEDRMEKVETKQASMEAKRAALKQKNYTTRKATATKIFTEQKENADRVLSVIARLKIKLNELASQGKDVTASLALLDTATTSANKAKTGADAGLTLVNSLTPDNLNTVFPQIRTQALTNHTNLEAAKKSIRLAITNAIKLLKTNDSTKSAEEK